MIDFRGFTALAACDQIDRHSARGDDKLTVDVRNPAPSIDSDQWQFINTTTSEVNERITIKNIISYGEFEARSRFALYSDNLSIPDSVRFLDFGLPVPVTPRTPFSLINLDYQRGEANSQQKTWTEELRLQGIAFDERLTYVVGGYLEFSKPTGLNDGVTGIFATCEDGGSPFDVALFDTNITDEEYAVATSGGYPSFGIEDLLYGEPKMYGMRVRYNFGE